jgi:hypothetical protein
MLDAAALDFACSVEVERKNDSEVLVGRLTEMEALL